MTCPFLEYRSSTDEAFFDVGRAYCTATDAFVQPMRADVCNDRYDLSHDRDCEIYRDHADATAPDDGTGTAVPGNDDETDAAAPGSDDG